MNSFFVLVLASALVLSSLHVAGAGQCGASMPPVGDPAPIVLVDVSLPPRQRFSAAVEAVVSKHGFSGSFGPLLDHYNETTFSHVPAESLAALSSALYRSWPTYAEELEGIASALGVSPLLLTGGWAWYHEIAHTEWAPGLVRGQARACTGYVAEDADGRVIHGRNHDDGDAALMRKVTLHLKFIDSSKNDEVIFEAVSWYWFGGVIETAVKAGIASMQENWRTVSTTSAKLLQAATSGVAPQGIMFREILMSKQVTSYQDVLKNIVSTPTAAAFYAVMSGPAAHEAAVVTREAVGVNTVPFPVVSLSSNATDGWFLVQTNYDRWLPDPATDPRRTDAMEAARRLGPLDGSTQFGAECVTSTPKVLNSDTIFTAILRADVGVLATYVRTSDS